MQVTDNAGYLKYRLLTLQVASISDIAEIAEIADLQTSHLRDSSGIRRIIPEPLSCGSDSYALSVHDTELS